MTPILSDLRRDPWFWFGLVLKIALLARRHAVDADRMVLSIHLECACASGY